MASLKCKSCGAQVDARAKLCPGCGAKVGSPVSPLPLMVVGLILAALLMFWFGR